MPAPQGSQLKAAIKQVMRQQKKSYEDLAEHLQVSEVTVKRFMSKEELSVSRLLEICHWLEVSLAQLEKLSQHNSSRKIHFTVSQEEFLAKNPQYLSFLFHLYSDDSPEKIQKKYKLSDKSLQLYLLRLEKHDLIVKKSGRYRPFYPEFPSPLPYGALLKAHFKNVVETGSGFFKRYHLDYLRKKDPENDKGHKLILSHMDISRASYLAWLEKYTALYQELVSTAQLEDKVEGLKDKKSVVMLYMSCAVDSNYPELEEIKNMFGYIGELT